MRETHAGSWRSGRTPPTSTTGIGKGQQDRPQEHCYQARVSGCLGTWCVQIWDPNNPALGLGVGPSCSWGTLHPSPPIAVLGARGSTWTAESPRRNFRAKRTERPSCCIQLEPGFLHVAAGVLEIQALPIGLGDSWSPRRGSCYFAGYSVSKSHRGLLPQSSGGSFRM